MDRCIKPLSPFGTLPIEGVCFLNQYALESHHVMPETQSAFSKTLRQNNA
ncbi:hypothetical protein WCU73_17875 [Pectobacterium brasiliense]